MVKIDADFVPATIPDDEVYGGTNVDPNVMACEFWFARLRALFQLTQERHSAANRLQDQVGCELQRQLLGH